MEDVKETKHETVEKAAAVEVIEQQRPAVLEDSQLQQNIQQQQNPQELAELKQIEVPGEKQQPEQQQQQQQEGQQQQSQTFDYEQDNIDDEDYEDDDEEKDTSQKLVIDIPDDEEEEKDEEEDEEEDVIPISDLPPQAASPKKETEKISPKPEKVETIITLSDGEEEPVNDGIVPKPGKVQKRRSTSAARESDHLRLKRRKIKVAGAPVLPLTGYLRYLNDRRETVRKEHPTKTHTEHNKMVADEWHALPADVKNSYLKAASVEKQRYFKELDSFLESHPEILASELAKNKIRKTAENHNSPNPAKENVKDKVAKGISYVAPTPQQDNDKLVNSEKNEKNKRKRTPTPPSANTNTNASASSTTANTTTSVATTAVVSASTSASSLVNSTPAEIPIFTNEFLEHNKAYDMELRSIRKSKTDLEQQNSVLEKHVENMKFGVEKMVAENNQLEAKNRLLEIYLEKLKRKLALALSALPLPTAPNGATVDNIDKYMQDLYKMSTSNSTGPATLNKAKDIIRKLDLQIHL